MPFTPGGMATLLQNDHTEIFQPGCKRLLYSFCRVGITVAMNGYHWAGDRRNQPEQFSCCSQRGCFGPDALVYLSRISDVTKIHCVVWYLNGIIGISLVRQLAQTLEGNGAAWNC